MANLPLDIWFEIGAFLVSLFCYPNIKNRSLKWFIPYLFFIVLIELSGHFVRRNNSWIYNISIPIEYFFFTFLFWNHYQDKLFKELAYYLLVLIPWLALVHTLFFQGFYGGDANEIVTNTLIAGSSIMIFMSCLYFIDLFRREEAAGLFYDPLFWISTALFFFNLVELPFNLFLKYIIEHRFDQQGKLFIAIHAKLNYLLYTFVAIGLLCTKKRSLRTSGSLLLLLVLFLPAWQLL